MQAEYLHAGVPCQSVRKLVLLTSHLEETWMPCRLLGRLRHGTSA